MTTEQILRATIAMEIEIRNILGRNTYAARIARNIVRNGMCK